MKPIRIVTVAPTPHLDGPGKVILGIFKHLDRSRFEPGFVSIIKRPESECYPSIAGALEDMKIPFESLDIKKPADLLSPVPIASFLKRFRADAVHTHLVRGNINGRVAARMAGIRSVISTVHSSKQWMESHPLLEFSAGVLDRLTVRLASVVVAVSEEVKQSVARLGGYKKNSILVIPNGTDTERFTPSRSGRTKARREIGVSESDFVVGFAGRIDVEKNPFLMLDVMKRAAKLVIAGEGRLSGELAALVRKSGLSEKVIMLGQRADIPSLLSGFDSFFMPSRWEGHPLALCEAMSTGLPCVATPVGGTSLMVRHGANGFLVPEDDRDGMVDAFLTLIDNPETAAAVGKEARETIQTGFSEEGMSNRYQELYSVFCNPAGEGGTKKREPVGIGTAKGRKVGAGKE